jgi:mannosyl-3-phosphoglycerate phosphatase family protein
MHDTVKRRIILFSDLDGTLLDSKTYSFEFALPALELIRKRDIPLVLCSSKSRAEVEVWRDRLDNRHPFIVENGGGIFIPEDYFPFPVEAESPGRYWVISLGTPYSEIREQFVRLRERLGFPARGFGDMTANEIAELTGLLPNEAILAKQRDYDEPFVFTDVPDEGFLTAIESSGLQWTQGRLYHIMGNHDKGKAVRLLRGLYERWMGPVTTIGLGDSFNDLPLLRVVDHPVLIMQENGSYDLRVNIPNLFRTHEAGPAGWNEAVQRRLAHEER